MSFLVDTNLVSEWTKPRPDPGVVHWLAESDEDHVFLSVITLAELRHGIERLPVGGRRKRLEEWLSDALPLRFEGRILPVDGAVADAWGRLMARRQAAGRPIGVMDAFIAATAEAHQLALVTRNARHFVGLTQPVICPWRGH